MLLLSVIVFRSRHRSRILAFCFGALLSSVVVGAGLRVQAMRTTSIRIPNAGVIFEIFDIALLTFTPKTAQKHI